MKPVGSAEYAVEVELFGLSQADAAVLAVVDYLAWPEAVAGFQVIDAQPVAAPPGASAWGSLRAKWPAAPGFGLRAQGIAASASLARR